MQHRRNRDAHGLNLVKHAAVVGEPATSELLSGQGPTLRIGVGNAHQISILEQTEHARVVPAHVANPDHADLHRNHGVGHQWDCANRLIIGDQCEAE